MKMLLAFALLPVLAQAKTLTVSCENNSRTKTIELVSEIANVTKPQVIKSLEVNGSSQSRFKDVSSMPIYKDGAFSLFINFGSNLYSSVELDVQKCTDSFEASGKGTLSEYVGGFAGSMKYSLTCTCELK